MNESEEKEFTWLVTTVIKGEPPSTRIGSSTCRSLEEAKKTIRQWNEHVESGGESPFAYLYDRQKVSYKLLTFDSWCAEDATQ